MASTTTNLGLTKPAYTDSADVAVINSNMDILDTKIGAIGNTSVASQIGTLSEQIGHYSGTETGDDFNTLTQSGVYTVATSTHSPTGGTFYGTVIVSAGRYNYITQIAISANAGDTYTRVTSNGGSTWSGWQKLALDSEKIGYNITQVWTGDVFTAPAGLYRCPSTAPNLPVGSNGYLTVIVRSDGLKFIQFITDSNKVFTNTQNNGNWAGWNELAAEPKANIVNVALSGATTYTFATATPFLLFITRSGTTLTGSFGLYIGFAGAQASALKEVVAPTAGIGSVSINNLVLTVTGSVTGQSMTIIYL